MMDKEMGDFEDAFEKSKLDTNCFEVKIIADLRNRIKLT